MGGFKIMYLMVVIIHVFFLFECFNCRKHVEEPLYADRHHNNTELRQLLGEVHGRCKNISALFNLSKTSVNGVPLPVIEFSKNPGKHVELVPELKLVANMHGNEVVGRELLLALAQYICFEYYEGNIDVQALVNTTRIYLIPSMNPDGWDLASREDVDKEEVGRNNANGVDLNRNFPDLDKDLFFTEGMKLSEFALSLTNGRNEVLQPETIALMHFILSRPLVLSANFHGGDLIVNYPFDESRSGKQSEYSATSDDNVFRYLASAYANNHPILQNHSWEGCDSNFRSHDGITNGAEWYSISGGMQDFNYLASNAFELTMEVGCTKYPEASELHKYWEDNKKPMFEFMWAVHSGIKGLVVDGVTHRGIGGARIIVRNITRIGDERTSKYIDHDIKSYEGGDYYRLLTAGDYEVTAVHPNYFPQTQRISVSDFGDHDQAARLDFILIPKVLSVREPTLEISAAQDYNQNEDDYLTVMKHIWELEEEKQKLIDQASYEEEQKTEREIHQFRKRQDQEREQEKLLQQLNMRD